MKKLYIGLCALLLCGLIAACSIGSLGEAGGDESSQVVVVTKKPEQASSLPEEKLEIALEDVKSAFKIFDDFNNFWYKGGNANAMTKEEIKHESMDYCRYETDEIKTYANFEETALALMTTELFESLQATLKYVEKDGALYGPVNFGKKPSTAFVGYESEAVKIGEKEYQLKVGHYYLASAFMEGAKEDEKVLKGETTLSYVLTENGWRFSSQEHIALDGFTG